MKTAHSNLVMWDELWTLVEAKLRANSISIPFNYTPPSGSVGIAISTRNERSLQQEPTGGAGSAPETEACTNGENKNKNTGGKNKKVFIGI